MKGYLKGSEPPERLRLSPAQRVHTTATSWQQCPKEQLRQGCDGMYHLVENKTYRWQGDLSGGNPKAHRRRTMWRSLPRGWLGEVGAEVSNEAASGIINASNEALGIIPREMGTQGKY